MTTEIESIDLFENDPIVSRIKDKIGNDITQQQIFLNSMYMFMKYRDRKDEFVVDLDDVWELVGFSRKDPAKRKLIKNFKKNEDYVIHPIVGTAVGGKINEKIMLNLNSFKEFCILANTEKGKQIRKYFIKMEEIVQEYVIDKIKEENEKIKSITKSDTLIEIYNKKSIIYLGLVRKMVNYYIYKYGETWDIKTSLKRHKNTYGEEFHYVYAIECDRKNDLEKIIKNHTQLIDKHIREYEGKERFELIRIDEELTLNKVISIIESSKQTLEAQNRLQIKEKEMDFQLGMEREKTLQIKERTKQMEIELEMIKIKKNETILSNETNDTQNETDDTQNETNDVQDETNTTQNEINENEINENEENNTNIINTVTDVEKQEMARWICEIFKHSSKVMINKEIYDEIYKELIQNDIQLLVKLKQTCGANPEKIHTYTRGYGTDFVKAIQNAFKELGLKKKESKAVGEKTGYFVCKRKF